MQTALPFLILAFFIYAGWCVVSLPFSPGKRQRKAWKAMAALVASVGAAVTFGIIENQNAKTAGFESMTDQSNAEKAGITDPAEWAEVREQELFKQRQAEAAALDEENARKRQEGIAAAEEASRIAEAKKAEDEREQAQAEATKLAKQQDCKKDIQCWGDEAAVTGTYDCTQLIERMAKHDFEWTDGMLEPKFSHYRWLDPEAGTITLIGDKIKMQNGFGAWTHMTYECDFNPISDSVVDVRVAEGRL